MHPIRPVVQLAPELVERLIQHEGVEHRFEGLTTRRQELGAVPDIPITLSEGTRDALFPRRAAV